MVTIITIVIVVVVIVAFCVVDFCERCGKLITTFDFGKCARCHRRKW